VKQTTNLNFSPFTDSILIIYFPSCVTQFELHNLYNTIQL